MQPASDVTSAHLWEDVLSYREDAYGNVCLWTQKIAHDVV